MLPSGTVWNVTPTGTGFPTQSIGQFGPPSFGAPSGQFVQQTAPVMNYGTQGQIGFQPVLGAFEYGMQQGQFVQPTAPIGTPNWSGAPTGFQPAPTGFQPTFGAPIGFQPAPSILGAPISFQPAPLQFGVPSTETGAIASRLSLPVEALAKTIPALIAPTSEAEKFAPMGVQRAKEKQLARAGRDIQKRLTERFFNASITETIIVLSSDADIEREKVVWVNNATSRFTAGETPLSGTLYDPTMGPSELHSVCTTCGQDIFGCPGHFGAIRFREGLNDNGAPILMYHPYFFDYTIYLMQAICRNCTSIVIGEEKAREYRYSGVTLLTMIAQASEGKRCVNPKCTPSGAGYVNPKIAINESKQSSNPQIVEIHGDKQHDILPIGRVWAIVNQLDPDAAYLQSSELAAKAAAAIPRELQIEITGQASKFSGMTDLQRDEEIRRRKRVLTALGYSLESETTRGTNPRAYLIQSLFVLPPKYRPARYINGEFQPHNFTLKYSEILKKLQDLGRATDKTSKDNALAAFIAKVRKLFVKTQESAAGRHADKSLADVLNRKNGDFRRRGQGKPVGNSARSVLDPEPDYGLGIVGIPQFMAAILTVPVTVTARNLPYLQAKMERGELLAYLPKGSYNKNDVKGGEELRRICKDIRLRVGDDVARPLRDGDRVVHYRAPTLHRFSLLLNYVKLHRGYNFLTNVMGLPGKNGDYDGDETNIAVLQDVESQAEADILMNEQKMLISARSSDPVAGPFYDAITSAALLTHPKMILTEETFVGALMKADMEDSLSGLLSRAERAHVILREAYRTKQERKAAFREKLGLPARVKEYQPQKYTGRLLFSAVLPPDFSYTGKEVIVGQKEVWVESGAGYDKKRVDIKERVVIRNGILLTGIIVQSVFGIASESFIQQLVHGYSTERALEFINTVTYITNYVFSRIGISVGIGGLAYDDPEFRARILEERISLQKRSLAREPPYMGFTTDERLLKKGEQYEKEAMAMTQATRATVDNITQETLGISNEFVFMSTIGSKGNINNASQMIAGVGQSSLNSKRLVPEQTWHQRCSVYFAPGDYQADARGYCEASFMEGLDLPGYAFHQIAGRESLTLMSNSTREVGKLRRMLIQSLQAIISLNDISIRASQDMIVQYIYGGHGWDPMYLRKVNTPYGTMTSFCNAKEIANKLNAELGF